MKSPVMELTALKKAGLEWGRECCVNTALEYNLCFFFVCSFVLNRTETENINSDAKANYQMAHQNSFFVIHFVDITRQIHSVNIYAIQYINHRKRKRKPPCTSFLPVNSVLSHQKDCLKSRESCMVRELLIKNAVTCKKNSPR